MQYAKKIIAGLLVLACAATSCSQPGSVEREAGQATVTSALTLTPTRTRTNTPTPTVTPTPLPTYTPTPLPQARLEAASADLAIGDYAAAADGYQRLLALPSLGDEEPSALLGLGLAHLESGAAEDAAESFRRCIDAFPDDERCTEAHMFLAQALMAMDQPLDAAGEYRAYLSAGTVITAYVQQWVGESLQAGEDYEGAIRAYEEAILAAPDLSFEVGTRERLALTYVALQDYEAAVAQYDAILDQARINAYRARIDYQAAETLRLAGETDAAYDRYLRVVESYPTAPQAYQALVRLVEARRPVDDRLRGIVDYYGQAYGPAVEAFYRYMRNYPDTYNSDAHYFAGLSYLAAGSPQLAAAEFTTLIEAYPDDPYYGDAWMGLADALYRDGDTTGAAATYRAFAEGHPEQRRAPEGLWRAAQILEWAGDLEEAAEAYMACHVAFPDSEYGAQALFRSGLQSYRINDLTGAAVAWDTLASVYTDPGVVAAALTWLGKVRLQQQDRAAALDAFGRARELDPLGWYGLRAAELAVNPRAPAFPRVRRGDARFDAPNGQDEANAWLSEWLELDSSATPDVLAPELAADARLRRGLELWRLRRFETAKAELELMRVATESDPLSQYQLALLFRDIGLYRSSILCATRLIALSPAASALEAPEFIARLAYPIYYQDLLLENATAADLSPLLVAAQIRQESLFESLAFSVASAHGLMQVIPATGEQIARELGWPPDFNTADLYLPYVSVRFGAYYLAQQRDFLDGRLDAALAGYNGGPGNALRWLEQAGDDPDLFLELITFSETNLYLRRIKESLAVYKTLYGS
ncbi:MAG: tetratricopeptide repeat protein [Chloroflexi bacterium]|nr:tetratricopeptide repeat protein [Chloroflexota bacterium]